MTFGRSVVTVVVAVAAVVAGCDSDDGRELRPPTSEQRAAMTTTTTSTTALPGVPPGAGQATTLAPASSAPAAAFTLMAPWADGGAIDARYTCDADDGNGVSPALSWTAPPAGTVELALVVTDDDAGDFVHRALAGIPPNVTEIAEGGTVQGAIEGNTSFGETGWGGPCPPSGTHTYRFSLYALSQQAEVSEGFGPSDLEAYTGAALAVAETTGTYEGS